MKYNFDEIFKQYPHVYHIWGGSIHKERFYAILSPFANCQTFCLTYAASLLNIKDEDMPEFMKDLFEIMEKRQCVIDLHSVTSAAVLKKLEPFTNNVVSTPYKSTNGSDMILHIIQFDRDKLI